MDAASELARRGHEVHVFTAHHDRARCFPETLDGESRTADVSIEQCDTILCGAALQSFFDIQCAASLNLGSAILSLWPPYTLLRFCSLLLSSGSFTVCVYGDFLPRHVFHRFHALCAYIRCIWVALCMLTWHAGEFDVVFVDQVSAVIPILRWRRGLKVSISCHTLASLHSLSCY